MDQEQSRAARADILSAAESIVNGDRNIAYGDPAADFKRTAAFWNAYIKGVSDRCLAQYDYEPGQTPIDLGMLEPHDVAAMMALLKLSRIAWAPDREDSWTDLAGYAACGWSVTPLQISDDDD